MQGYIDIKKNIVPIEVSGEKVKAIFAKEPRLAGAVLRKNELEEDEIVDISEYMRECTKYIECTKFHRETSKTVDTAKPDLLANMGKYCDEVHYVTDTSKAGRYSPQSLYVLLRVKLDLYE